jgi:hypothetical protein
MSISDDSFRDAFKPLHIPAHYKDAVTDEHKVIFALAQIGQGSAGEVASKLKEADSTIDEERFIAIAASVLDGLFEKGLIRGVDRNGEKYYDLSKVTEANNGAVNPDLLAPGLD